MENHPYLSSLDTRVPAVIISRGSGSPTCLDCLYVHQASSSQMHKLLMFIVWYMQVHKEKMFVVNEKSIKLKKYIV